MIGILFILIHVLQYFLEKNLPLNTSHSLDETIVNRSQSHIEDKYSSNDIWGINYRANTILERPRFCREYSK